ncbi:MAG: ABC transporter permease, partial [Actinobacteria bacterium]|nr:ABC transporter permease [Actinomycetota bacterium]
SQPVDVRDDVVPIRKAPGKREWLPLAEAPAPPTDGPSGPLDIAPTMPEHDDLLPPVRPRRRGRTEVPQAPPEDDHWADAPWSYAPPQEQPWTDEPWLPTSPPPAPAEPGEPEPAEDWPDRWLKGGPRRPAPPPPPAERPRVDPWPSEPRPWEPWSEEPVARSTPAPNPPRAPVPPPAPVTIRPLEPWPIEEDRAAGAPAAGAPEATPVAPPAPSRPRRRELPARRRRQRPEPPRPTRERRERERAPHRARPAWAERVAVAHRSAVVLRRLSIRGLIARKVRLALTALAVVLGVCFVSGTYVLTDTLKSSFDRVFAQTAVGVDAVVRTRSPFNSNNVSRVRLPAGVLTLARETPGVGGAEGVIQGPAEFVARDGKRAIDTGGAPSIGISWDVKDHVSPVRVAAGRAPLQGGEVAMDVATARREGFRVGDTVRVLLSGPAQQQRLVGTFCFASQCDLGGAAFAAFDVRTAQHVFNSMNAYDFIDVKAKPGVPPAQMIQSLRDALPGYDVTDAATVARETGQQVHDAFGFLNDALLGFASIGVFVGAFIIFNTFTILVSQRTRELGLLRALGARSGQVMRSVIGEAAAVGVLASIVGLLLGIGLAEVLLRVVERLGLHIPPGNTVLLQRTIIAAFVVGISVTVASAVYPALRAARVPPVAAINDYGPQASAPLLRRAITGSVILIAGLVVLVVGLLRHYTQLISRMEIVGIGAIITFVGVAVLSPVFARPLSRMLGWPILRAIGVTGTLARGNAMRNPRRTAATASALTIGLSLVCLVAIFAASAKASLHNALDTGVRADYILSSQQFAGFSPVAAQRVRALPAVRNVVSLRFDDAQIGNNTETVTGVDPQGLTNEINLGMVSGSAQIGSEDVLVHDTEASGYHVSIGSTLMIWFPRTGPQPLRVAGIYRNNHFTGGIPVNFLITRPAFETNFGTNQQDTLVYVGAKPGERSAAQAQIQRVLNDFPNVTSKTPAGFQRQQEQTINLFLSVLIALLLLSEVIAILGIVNTLALSVFERTHELGMLRAVGMTRRQMRRMVRAESVIIAVVGGLLGIAVGIFWGWAMTRALRDQGITHFSLPTVQLIVFLIASAVAGVIAAVLPAWRAGRLDVLQAIATTE